MLLDSSALVALITAEGSAPAVFDALAAAPSSAIGAPTLVEAAMVLTGRRAAGSPAAASDLALVMAHFEIAVIPFAAEHWPVAWVAFLRYGKGRHPAGLNLGDCLTYAVAKLSGQALLCVGGDFAQTDLLLAPLPA